MKNITKENIIAVEAPHLGTAESEINKLLVKASDATLISIG